jgi:hypothetical protein
MKTLAEKSISVLNKLPFILLFFTCTLAIFIYQARHARFIYDDYYLLAVTSKFNYLESVKYLYRDMNGRWTSNLLTAFVFGTLGPKIHLYWYFHLTQFLLFIAAVSFFFRSVFRIGTMQSFKAGIFFGCLFYWFYFDARIEVWFWEASCLVHLVSLIAIFFLYGVIFNPWIGNSAKALLVVLLSIFIGGVSESFAFACWLLSLYLFIRNPKNKTSRFHLAAVFFISVSFAINYFSPATAVRTGYLPEPTVSEGFKNTAYTFYLQAKKIKHIPFKLFGLFLLLPLASMLFCFGGQKLRTFSFDKFSILLIILIIFENTFLPAYSISQEAPDRTFALTWIIVLLLGLNYLLKREKLKAARGDGKSAES